jgi:hypothetical protein
MWCRYGRCSIGCWLVYSPYGVWCGRGWSVTGAGGWVPGGGCRGGGGVRGPNYPSHRLPALALASLALMACIAPPWPVASGLAPGPQLRWPLRARWLVLQLQPGRQIAVKKEVPVTQSGRAESGE